MSFQDLWCWYRARDKGFLMFASHVVDRTIDKRNESAKKKG